MIRFNPPRCFRFSTLLLAVLLLCARAPIHAQQPRAQVFVTGAAVYARAFGDGGAGVAIDALRALPVRFLGTEHAFGLSFWYAKTAIASGDPFGRRRRLAGVGVQWQAGAWTLDRRLLFYVSAPLQLVMSSIPSPGLFLADASNPIPDRSHDEKAISIGVGTGVAFQLTTGVGLRVGVRRLFHQLFDTDKSALTLAVLGLTVTFVEGGTPRAR